MVTAVKLILNSDISVVLKSAELSLSLLKCYSILYLNNGQPRVCERSQRAYYSQLQKSGIMKASKQEEINNRTLKPSFKGLKYIPQPFCKHINSDYLTDADAIELLNAKALRESDFQVLPEGYNVTPKVEEVKAEDAPKEMPAPKKRKQNKNK